MVSSDGSSEDGNSGDGGSEDGASRGGVSRNDAHRAAQRVLARSYGDEAVGSSLVIEGLSEVSNAWIVAFDRADLDTDDPTRLPMVRNIIVPKDGADAHYPPTALPILEYLSQVETGQTCWVTA